MIDELARLPDPGPRHAELRGRGPHPTPDGRWVVAAASDVAAVLGSPDAVVGFTADPARPVSGLQGRMARFTDGPEHARRRASTVSLLADLDPGALRRAAADRAADRLAGAGELEVMAALARWVPVAVLAEAMGVADPDDAVAAVAELAGGLAPPLGAPTATGAGAAADRLAGLLAHTEPDGDLPVDAIGVLFQAFDATAGLVGNAVLGLARGVGIDALLVDTLRRDAPVQLTTRLAERPLAVGDRTVPAGRRVVVALAAATTDPLSSGTAPPGAADPIGAGEPRLFGFGAGRHACPGARQAVALAAGVLDALVAAGATVPDQQVVYEPRVNLRIPERVVVRLPGGGGVSAAPSGSPRPAG